MTSGGDSSCGGRHGLDVEVVPWSSLTRMGYYYAHKCSCMTASVSCNPRSIEKCNPGGRHSSDRSASRDRVFVCIWLVTTTLTPCAFLYNTDPVSSVRNLVLPLRCLVRRIYVLVATSKLTFSSLLQKLPTQIGPLPPSLMYFGSATHPPPLLHPLFPQIRSASRPPSSQQIKGVHFTSECSNLGSSSKMLSPSSPAPMVMGRSQHGPSRGLEEHFSKLAL